MHRVFVVEQNSQITNLFREKTGFMPTVVMKSANVVVFPGGPDVNPALYGADKHPTTSFHKPRDDMFQAAYNLIKKPDILKIGICGGGQFLNVMNGGKMYQDVDRHAIGGFHDLVYSPYPNQPGAHLDGTKFLVTSTHHQMMIGTNTSELWGWADESTARAQSGLHELRKPGEPDTEILWYPETSCLCFQPHPEYNRHGSTADVFWKCVQTAIQRNRIKGY